MADFVTLLTDMGFDKNQAMKAVEKTGNVGVEPAMEWLLSNPGEETATVPTTNVGGDGSSPSGSGEVADVGNAEGNTVPKSWKCEDCGKIFSTMDTVEFHAAKTNHSNFSESTEEKKPLTEEEKAEQQKKLMELLKVKRAEREAKEKIEEIEKEKSRMASGKDLGEAKKRLQEQEMKELIELRRREKVEDKLARDRVKAQIEADKLARKAKFGGGGGSSLDTAVVETPSAKSSVSAMETESVVKKDYTQTKLQLRLPNGRTMTQTFGVNEPLAAVRVYVELNRDDGGDGQFNLMTNFPKRVFEGEDYDKPLAYFGLVPSAVLMVTRRSS